MSRDPADFKKPSWRRYWWSAALSLALSITGLILIGSTGYQQSWRALQAVGGEYLAAAAVLVFILWSVEIMRMRLILFLLDEHLSVKNILQINLAFIFAAAVTPAASGGPPAHAYFLYRKGIKGEKAVAAVSARTLFATCSLALLNPVIVLSFRDGLGLPKLAEQLVPLAVIFVSAGILFFLCLVLHPRLFFSWLCHFLPVRVYAGISARLEEFSLSFRTLLFSPHRKILFFILVLSLAYWGVFFSLSWVLARGLGSSTPWTIIVARQAVLQFLLSYVPLPGASGVAELGYAAFFAAVVPDTLLRTLVACWRFFTYYLNIIVGGAMFWWLNRNLYKKG